MLNFVKKILTVDVPLFAVVLFCGATAYGVHELLPTATGKYLVAEKSAIILQAVFERQGLPDEEMEKQIGKPILAVLKKYADQGYVVIDAAKDEQGNLSIAAMPNGTRDISAELRAAIEATKGQ